LIGRIVRSVDFERVMAAPSRAKTKHFVLHHLADVPSRPRFSGSAKSVDLAAREQRVAELLTAGPVIQPALVDDSPSLSCNHACASQDIWLGLVVPKRHAKRSVTRQLLKRHMRAAVCERQALTPPLSQGLWVLRLRAAFDVKQYPSAASVALAREARQELTELLRRVSTAGSGVA
jgi:ribonuclease P protein component